MENVNRGEIVEAPGLCNGVYVDPSLRTNVGADLDDVDEVGDSVGDDDSSDLGYVSLADFNDQNLCREEVRSRVFGISDDLLDVDALQLREQGFVNGADMIVDTNVDDAGLRIPDGFYVVGKNHFRQTGKSLHIPRTVKTFADFKAREDRRAKKPADSLSVVLDRRAAVAASRAIKPDYQE